MSDSVPEKPDATALLGHVETLARRAGAEIMRYYNGEAQAGIAIKDDGSEVTAADLASEKIILPALAKLTPDIPIVSEERVAAGDIPDIGGGTFWTVDPLDGTKEFIKRTGAFVVAIALIVENKPVLGVIYHPAKGLLYSAAGPGTATKVDATGARAQIGAAAKKNRRAKMRVLVNRPHANMKNIKGWLSGQFGNAARIDTRSGVFRACQVAEGRADMAVYEGAKREGRQKWWDAAPGHAIIEAAGGKVKTPDGKPLLYKDADLCVPPYVATAPHFKKPSAVKKTPKT